MQKGDVVIIRDDVPSVTWRLGVIKDLIVGGDGLVRAATIRTANRTTTRPITKVYSLELNEGKTLDSRITQDKSVLAVDRHTDATLPPVNSTTTTTTRPQRSAARRATNLMKEWASVLSGPPEDVAENEDELQNVLNILRIIGSLLYHVCFRVYDCGYNTCIQCARQTAPPPSSCRPGRSTNRTLL